MQFFKNVSEMMTAKKSKYEAGLAQKIQRQENLIHIIEYQRKIFELQGLSEKEINEQIEKIFNLSDSEPNMFKSI